MLTNYSHLLSLALALLYLISIDNNNISKDGELTNINSVDVELSNILGLGVMTDSTGGLKSELPTFGLIVVRLTTFGLTEFRLLYQKTVTGKFSSSNSAGLKSI